MPEVACTCPHCGVGCGHASLRAPKEVALEGDADRFAVDGECRSRELNHHV